MELTVTLSSPGVVTTRLCWRSVGGKDPTDDFNLFPWIFFLFFVSWQSGGVSIPAMKVVNPASRLKQGQQGSPDKGKHIKQRMEYMRIQGQQQVLHPQGTA